MSEFMPVSAQLDAAIEAVSEPTRRRIVEKLRSAPMRPKVLADELGISVPALSRHLKLLRERGIVDRVAVEGDARGRQYALRPDALDALGDWLSTQRWATALGAAAPIGAAPDLAVFLERIGGFLDGFLTGDAAYFERHLADDALLWFPGSAQPWRKQATVDSVAGHPPYVEWTIGNAELVELARGVTLVAIDVRTRRTADDEPTEVVQTMIFDDTAGDPDRWSLRFLQQTPI